MRVERVSIDDERLSDYRLVRDPALLRESGVFVAEGRLVVRILLERSDFTPRSLLGTQAALDAFADIEGVDDLPFFLVDADEMETVAGYRFHQGCLAAAELPTPTTVTRMLQAGGPGMQVVVGLEAVSNPDNVGAIFRSAAAFRARGVLLSEGCCSPLYRKAVRTSMGASLVLPFSMGAPWNDELRRLREMGFTLVALTPGDDAEPVEALGADAGTRIALLLGAEGEGLTDETLALADRRVRIPIDPTFDSLNVAAAAAIAMYVASTREPASPAE